MHSSMLVGSLSGKESASDNFQKTLYQNAPITSSVRSPRVSHKIDYVSCTDTNGTYFRKDKMRNSFSFDSFAIDKMSPQFVRPSENAPESFSLNQKEEDSEKNPRKQQILSFRASDGTSSSFSDTDISHSSTYSDNWSNISSVSEDIFDSPHSPMVSQLQEKEYDPQEEVLQKLSAEDDFPAENKMSPVMQKTNEILDLSDENKCSDKASDDAYKLLSNSIKQELFRALEHLVDKSARSVLADLKQRSTRNLKQTPKTANSPRKETSIERSEHSRENKIPRVSKEPSVSVKSNFPKLIPQKISLTSNVIIQGDHDHLRTASQSQLCFGEVIVENNGEEQKSCHFLHKTHEPPEEVQDLKEQSESCGAEHKRLCDSSKVQINVVSPTFPDKESSKQEPSQHLQSQTTAYSKPNDTDKVPLTRFPTSFHHPSLLSSFPECVSSLINKTALSTTSPYVIPPKISTSKMSSGSFLSPLAPLIPPPPEFLFNPQFNAYQAAFFSSLMKSQTPQLTSQPNEPFTHFSSNCNWGTQHASRPFPYSKISSQPFVGNCANQEKLKRSPDYPSFHKSPGKINSKSHRSHYLTKSDPFNYKVVRRVSPFASIRDGLTPQHLRKAKLIFFYARYPNTNTIKTYFSDVQFTRATTSQLIKWFSNFREFFYIQIEKFARQALNEGVTDPEQLRIGKDSEVFRVLKHHFNKNSDYKVPQEFLTVTLKSLQEFYAAIKLGKDFDPAWKKSIYKIICKLDQNIPEFFKSSNLVKGFEHVEQN